MHARTLWHIGECGNWAAGPPLDVLATPPAGPARVSASCYPNPLIPVSKPGVVVDCGRSSAQPAKAAQSSVAHTTGSRKASGSLLDEGPGALAELGAPSQCGVLDEWRNMCRMNQAALSGQGLLP